ncbi:molybdate ABC transporter substrate-binding protein [Flavitalea flava]
MKPFLLYLLLGCSTFAFSQTPAKKINEAKDATASKEVLIAGASDLKFAMDSLITVFIHENPGTVIKPVYGSSGNFYEQISSGAPFDLFFSADMDYPRKLQGQKKTLTPVKQYGTGQIVLWSQKKDPSLEKMDGLLVTGVHIIAIANPAHAPYGKRAEESLRYYKIYDKVKNKLVLGENISQAAQFARSGAADIGILALSLAMSPTMQKDGGKYWLIPAETHQPLDQGYVLLQHAKGNVTAERFAGFINSARAAVVLRYFGL